MMMCIHIGYCLLVLEEKKIAKNHNALLFCSQNHRQKLPRTDEQLADANWNCCSLRHTSHFFHSMIFSCRSFCETYFWKQIDKIRDTKQLKIKPHGRVLPCRTSFFSNIYHVWMIVLFMENDIGTCTEKRKALVFRLLQVRRGGNSEVIFVDNFLNVQTLWWCVNVY